MSNRTQMLSRLREELGDTGSDHLWSDTLLEDLLVEANGWYSRLKPFQATVYRDVAAGQRTFTSPPGALGVAQVECPPGRVLPQEAGLAGGGTGSTPYRQSWSEWGGVIYLANSARGDEVGAARMVVRVLLTWDRPDPVEQWNGPTDDERLLILWAATEAWAWLDGQDQKRGRPARQGGMTARYAAELQKELDARRQAAGSRRLQVG